MLFILQSIVVGLAVAFLVVLFRPDLLPGFGGNGRAIAGTMQMMGMKIFGINRSGTADVPIEFIGNISNLRKVLKASDVVVVTTPLNRETRDMIGTKELEWMK